MTPKVEVDCLKTKVNRQRPCQITTPPLHIYDAAAYILVPQPQAVHNPKRIPTTQGNLRTAITDATAAAIPIPAHTSLLPPTPIKGTAESNPLAALVLIRQRWLDPRPANVEHPRLGVRGGVFNGVGVASPGIGA